MQGMTLLRSFAEGRTLRAIVPSLLLAQNLWLSFQTQRRAYENHGLSVFPN